jgi:hypothetical protein
VASEAGRAQSDDVAKKRVSKVGSASSKPTASVLKNQIYKIRTAFRTPQNTQDLCGESVALIGQPNRKHF